MAHRYPALAVGLAALLSATMAAAQTTTDPQTRRLSRVPSPTGPSGATTELYTGSYALLVGVSKYDNAAWPALDSIPGELDNLAAALRGSGFDAVEQLRNPTSDELKRGVQAFISKYGYVAGHRLVFFFSGHGYSLDKNSRGYFVPRDAPDPERDEAAFRGTALSMQQVSTWATDLVAKHAMFAFDSCFSGTIFRTRDRIPVPARISELTAKPVRVFMSAGGAGEPVPARSVFTPMFARGVKGAADLDEDGFVTGTELGNYVQREVIAYKTRQVPQFGKIRDPELDEGDLVFAIPAAPSSSALSVDQLYAQASAHYDAGRYAEAFPLMLRAGSGGKVEAGYRLGYLYDNGLGVERNDATAREWYGKSAAAGVVASMNNLGVLYEEGHGGPVDLAAALEQYRKSAEGGNVFGMFNFGRLHEQGKGTAANRAEAVRWYRRAAVLKNENAIKALSRLGEPVAINWSTVDPAEALTKGLEHYLARRYAESFEPMLRAGTGGKLEAAYRLGYLYSNGLGVERNYVAAREWYQKSADIGSGAGMNNLGTLYEEGHGVTADIAAAKAWYEKGAAAGDDTSMWNLARLHEYGKGTPVNRAQAVTWYRKSAALKNEGAIKDLARLGEPLTGNAWSTVDPAEALTKGLEHYRAGRYVESFDPLMRAATGGNDDAAFYLGYIYTEGKGIAKDLAKGHQWYQKSAAAGDSSAMNNLGLLYEHGEGVPRDYATAFQWYQKSAIAGGAGGMANLGDMYEFGKGVAANRDVAINWYRKAAALKNDRAIKALARLGVSLSGGTQ